jgi:hypothetical protein
VLGSTITAGRLDETRVDSAALRGNPLGDPADRPLWVYLPPGYDDKPDRRYPSIYVLQGYSGTLAMWHNRNPFRPTFPELVDELFGRGDVPPAIVVFVDAWTAYGCSYFVDSVGSGDYHTYLCEEVVPFVDLHYRTLPHARHRAVTGKSAGGYGAMITPLLRPDVFGALATHAGSALHESCYLQFFAPAVRHLRRYDGDIFAWWQDFRSRPAFSEDGDKVLLRVLGTAACYSADDDGTPLLPFNPSTGVLRDDVWQRWLDADPVRMVPRHRDAARSLHSVWVDAGTRDDYYLDVAAGAFVTGLRDAGLPDSNIHFELFRSGHTGIDHRYPPALAWLAERLSDDNPGGLTR